MQLPASYTSLRPIFCLSTCQALNYHDIPLVITGRFTKKFSPAGCVGTGEGVAVAVGVDVAVGVGVRVGVNVGVGVTVGGGGVTTLAILCPKISPPDVALVLPSSHTTRNSLALEL